MNYRVFVEKKENFDVEAAGLTENFKSVLNIEGLEAVRVINIYDVFNIDENVFKAACDTVFSEPPADILYTDGIILDGSALNAEKSVKNGNNCVENNQKNGENYAEKGIKSGENCVENGLKNCENYTEKCIKNGENCVENGAKNGGNYVENGLKNGGNYAGKGQKIGEIHNENGENYSKGERLDGSKGGLSKNAVDLRGKVFFAVESLPGQYDQRGDSAEQCVRLIRPDGNAVIKSGKLFVLEGKISPSDLEFIKKQVINPIESREKNLFVLEPPKSARADRAVPVLKGFNGLSVKGLDGMKKNMGLAMNTADLAFIQKYFQNIERRDPSETEIRVLDTYWSDHCRHTTFETEIAEIEFPKGKYGDLFKKTYENYIRSRKNVYGDKEKNRAVTLMDLATVCGKEMRKDGRLNDIEVSGEVNACSLYVDAETENGVEKWILQFKNETHNHPTEIEPYGGASTCIGGAIRDPLSGRAYVYQSMRVSGAGDPTAPVSSAIEGKLPQRVITKKAAQGFSAYGNQIGLAATHISEIYHEGYTAKRLEAGFVAGAVKAENVRREEPSPGDVVILLGGRTGRDGIGGATGSSKEHDALSTEKSASEVQKGNAPEERKIQRLFRNPAASRLIKKCNDFGAGGVSVAIGELADGIKIDLDKVTTKYDGLSGTELAISESQERMAVVTDKADAERFIALAAEENLEADVVAEITGGGRLEMKYGGKPIVDLRRDFLNTNGVRARVAAEIEAPKDGAFPNAEEENGTPKNGLFLNPAFEIRKAKDGRFLNSGTGIDGAKDGRFLNSGTGIDGEKDGRFLNSGGGIDGEKDGRFSDSAYSENGGIEPRNLNGNIKEKFLKNLAQFNVASQKGLVETFDNTIGASTVLMPFGGKYQETPADVSVQKLPVRGRTKTASIAAYGYNPYLSERSPFHGALYAVVESAAKIVAAGAGFSGIRFTFQEYFEKPGTDKKRWGKPLAALLGAYAAQQALGLPSIGGKDSMSGTFKNIDVPPTLISFAVKTVNTDDVISAEFKKAGRNIYLFSAPSDDCGIIDFERLKDNFSEITERIKKGSISAAAAVRFGGVGEALAKMSFGNGIGFEVNFDADGLFEFRYGAIAAESKDEIDFPGALKIGRTTESGYMEINGEKIERDEALLAYRSTFESVFPSKKDLGRNVVPVNFTAEPSFAAFKYAKPKVVIPAFYGTNCEYDSESAFLNAGAEVSVPIFRTLSPKVIEESIDNLVREIKSAQIIMFPGGFSAGDEPDGSAKYIANVIRNAKTADAINEFLARDGLILGVCNGFQALIKSGLVPNGKITPQNEGSATLTYNAIGRHVAKIVPVRIASNKSPWFYGFKPGDIHYTAMSHGEGRLAAPQNLVKNWIENGQICAQYADLDGNPTMLGEFNPNGSVMAVEALCSPDGRILGKMGHNERTGDGLYKNVYGDKNGDLFKNGVKYFA
ncbi:MAG: phosphoribosylformylglycinamidine synthase subunit PurQ [Clostridiales bacterium]|nr:phosphoribosylformylglycinamidine synthase subunit PurQ [Clostridiales bacterium]